MSFLVICHYSTLFAQCVDNSNYWIESWTSCSTSQNPNQARGMSNWLLFEFDENQAIGTTTIWNANRSGESGLGAKEVFIDISIDGTTWIQVGMEAFSWPKGTEAIDYAGFEGPDLSSYGFIKKVLVTVVSNHEGSNCMSIAEFKFDINPDECYGNEDDCGVCDGPGTPTWFQDQDGDGLGDPDERLVDCTQPPGYVDNDDDPCDNGLIGWSDMETLFYDIGCTGCHGINATGGLDLSTFEGISAGGNICGQEILTGNTLVGIISIENFVGCGGETFANPMNERVDNAMSQSELAKIQEWIDSGAPYDCACPPGSVDSDQDGICDASDECPDFDNSLIGTPCDDGQICTIFDVYVNSCDCRGEEVQDSDNDGVCDILDVLPNNPCSANGNIGGLQPGGWRPSESNDCDGDGISVEDGDLDDFDECITDIGPSFLPDCFCLNSSFDAGAKYIKSVGVNTSTVYHGQGLPDGVMSSIIGWMDYADFYFPHAEITQEICFDVGFGSEDSGVKFEINELGSYKFFNPDPTLTDYEPQTFCFQAFVPGSQTVRVSRHLTGTVRVDGSSIKSCRCTLSDPRNLFPSCVCPGDMVEGTGDLGITAGFADADHADGYPDGQFTFPIGGPSDSLEYFYEDLPINSEICVVIAFDNLAGKVGFELNGAYFEITNLRKSDNYQEGQNLCFLTTEAGDQLLKIKEVGSGRMWVDGTYTLSCTNCEEDSDNDNVCDEDDICPGFDDNKDEDFDGIPDGCDPCNGNLLNTSCDDNDRCTANDIYDEDCNCAGTFADNDNDGVCNADDQCPNFDDNLIGTPCDDEDICTEGETYDTDCGCSGGIFQDSDNDGICDAEDECDPSQEGNPCDDNDPCTTDDALDTDCNCAGIFQDSDEDGICDAEDECDNNLAGTECDDNDPCTTQDVFDTDCNCAGVFQDSDEDGICDAEDECDANLAGTECDDNDPCTAQDVFDTDCNCAGVVQDTDEDGICDEEDACPNFDNQLIGTPCDDGDICTLGETYDDNCGCSGGVFQDADNDGICDAEDECDTSLVGTECDDNDPCTVQDIYDTDCNCAGTFMDSDDDGVCDEDDACPNFDNQLIGMPCDDGDVCTLGETYDDNCGCSGGVFQDADNDGICDAEDECDTSLVGTDCDDNDPCTTQDVYDTDCNCAGTFMDSDDDGVCDEDDNCPNFNNQLIGTPCDDGDVCTLGETYDDNCGCSGGIFQDEDEDGICDAEDECDTSLAGTECDDNDPCTVQDVYDIDCNCVGTFQDADQDGVCDQNDICPGGNDNLDADGDGIPDFCDDCNATLTGGACDDDDPCTANDILDADCNCAGVFLDTDADGVCDADDVCPEGDDNLDADEDGIPDACDQCDENLVGTSCNDEDECTAQDVYDSHCDCIGVFMDTDLDGVCDADDICPDGDDNLDIDQDGVPDACDECNNNLIGTNCDDEDACTIEDVFDTNCNCLGIYADADQDGVCDAEDVCPDGDDNLDMDEDGIPDACDECDDSIIGSSCDDEDHCTGEDVYDEDCNCIGIFLDADDDGVCDEEDICPQGDDNLDMDEDGIPDACDECTDALIEIPNNVFEHSGPGFASKSILIGNKVDPTFTIKNLDANTNGDLDSRYADLIEVKYTDASGDTKLHGTFSGEDQSFVDITIQGVVEKLILKLQDGLGTNPDKIDVFITDITACEFNDINTNTASPIINSTYFKIFPNPTQGDFSIEFNSAFNTDYKIMITDVFGKNHYLQSFYGDGDIMLVAIDGSNLGQGFYFVTLYDGLQKITKKVVILNK